jgi:hypothetical protein
MMRPLGFKVLTGYSPGHVQPRGGLRAGRVVVDRGLAQEQFGDRDHRDQRDHREPRKTVAECRSAMSNS